jgi:hypothetical protein
MAARSDDRPAVTTVTLAFFAFMLAAAVALAESPSAGATFNTLLDKLGRLPDLTSAEVQDVVEAAGGIPFPAKVPTLFLTPAELRAYLREVVDSEYPPDKARADERTLVAFDLIAPGLDLRQARLELLEQNIAGFYDERPERRRLYVVSDKESLTPLNQLVLAHEMRHALQDQDADVHAVVPDAVGDFDDRRLAYLAVLEGDATLIMERFLRQRLEHGGPSLPELLEFELPTSAMPGAPAILRDQMVLPYVIGTPFARELERKAGWAEVRKAWHVPPESTEQVLHPEKYWAHEVPLPVEVGYAPEGATVVAEGVLGEAYMRTLLGEGSAAAAAGWGGDRFRVFGLSGNTLLVWHARWDTETDAREAEAALSARYARTHARARPHGRLAVLRKGPWNVSSFRRGSDTWLVSSDARRLLDKTLNELEARKGDR